MTRLTNTDEIKEARNKLGDTIFQAIQKWQEDTGIKVINLEMKSRPLPDGRLNQSLAIEVDSLGDLDPKPKSNIITAPAQPGLTVK